ncbi:MAG TPA: class III extradiol ring-cleavage dioxygenase [Polyangiaceae bacterium]|nr:class III extradiol ring-cleavage dioxygenase [Polyangiaceae bacterium]
MRFPAIYIPHGGGPWPFVDVSFGPKEQWAPLEAYLRALVSSLPERPRALLVVSAHWEEPVITVMSGVSPPMLYDYSGFAPEAYQLEWPAPGAPHLVAQARALLDRAGFQTAEDARRGFDHGTFVPLKLAVPAADIPVLQVSLLRSLDAEAHLAIGRALAPLRDGGVLLVGSGNSYHNMRGFGHPASAEPSRRFDAWIADSVRLPAAERADRLRRWKEAPDATQCHPREEHLLPLHVMAGAGGDDVVTLPFRGEVLGVRAIAVQFG